MNRDDFLRRLRERPAGRHLAPEAPPPLPTAAGDLRAAFCAAATANGCRVLRGCRDTLQRALAQEIGQGTVLVGSRPELAPWTHALIPAADRFGADWGIVLADAALARTGSVCLMRRPQSPLSHSLVPPSVAVVVPAARLLWDLSDFFATLQDGAGSIAVVSGPSRTADIENDLSIGVHGPGQVLVLLCEED